MVFVKKYLVLGPFIQPRFDYIPSVADNFRTIHNVQLVQALWVKFLVIFGSSFEAPHRMLVERAHP